MSNALELEVSLELLANAVLFVWCSVSPFIQTFSPDARDVIIFGHFFTCNTQNAQLPTFVAMSLIVEIVATENGEFVCNLSFRRGASVSLTRCFVTGAAAQAKKKTPMPSCSLSESVLPYSQRVLCGNSTTRGPLLIVYNASLVQFLLSSTHQLRWRTRPMFCRLLSRPEMKMFLVNIYKHESYHIIVVVRVFVSLAQNARRMQRFWYKVKCWPWLVVRVRWSCSHNGVQCLDVAFVSPAASAGL